MVRACSFLDEMVIDKPKVLYRQFERLGVYQWEHVFETADKDIDNDIMAIRFSNTELLTNPISWEALQFVLAGSGCKSQIQSPTAISKMAN